MKSQVLTLFFILTSISIYAQKSGFDDIQINSKLSDLKAFKKYYLTKDTANSNWIVRADTLSVFLTEIEHLKLEVDKQGIIKKITVYSKPIIFKNYIEWKRQIPYLMNYIDNQTRRTGSLYYSHNQDKFSMVWSLKEYKTALFFETKQPKDFMATNFAGTYIFLWVEDKDGMAGVTF